KGGDDGMKLSAHLCASIPVTSPRISDIAIAGRYRTNTKINATNSPIVPAKVDQSQMVGRYMPQDDGRKSRCRLTTTITKRSSHMPRFTTSETTKSTSALRRSRRDQRNCGAAML